MIQSLIYGLLTFILTGLGASLVFFMRETPSRFLSFSLGFAGGVMISTSFFSLILPALKIFGENSLLSAFKLTFGFFLGLGFLRMLDLVVPHLHLGAPPSETEGLAIPIQKGFLLFLAVTLHNVPEGLSVGVSPLLELAIAIGAQNIPEGLALALAFRAANFSRMESFFYGFLSAVVEPIFALVGALTIGLSNSLLPYAMSLAAGAMIFITIEELLPTAQRFKDTDLSSAGFGLGFIGMLILDVGLG